MNEIKKNPMYLFLVVLTVSATVGLQGWRTLFDNFAVRVVNLDGGQVGLIQSAREIPGFLTLLAIYVMLVVREHRLSAFSVLVLGLGVAATGYLPSFSGLMATTVIMSFGFHFFETTNQSLTLQYFDSKTSPWVFGRLRSLAAASNVVLGVVIYFTADFLHLTQIYLVIGGLVLAAGLWGLTRDPIDRTLTPQRKKMVFRRKYWLFYLLTFLAGARRQIFVAFALFLMVKHHGFTVREITIMFVLNNIVGYVVNPLIGRSIIRFGERRMLSVEYFSLIFIFLAYAFVDSKAVMWVLYILDHLFYNFFIAIRTYFQKVADPRDIAPSMAVGFTINHVAAVVLPALGGMLWLVDYRIPFVGGAILAVCSLTAVQFIRVPDPD